MPDLITSSSNPLIKQARALHQKKARDESGLFLVEGILHVGEVFEAGWQIESALVAPNRLKSDFALELLTRLEQRGVRCAQVTEEAFESFAEKDNPSGIAAIVRQKKFALTDFSLRQLPFLVAVVSPQDPGNVGTILRTMDAVGAHGLALLDGGVDLYHPSAVRASMGALFWKPVFRLGFAEFAAWVHANGCRMVGTASYGSVDYRAFIPDARPLVLLLGSEQKGLTPEQIAACHDFVSLPMRGRADSLNLAVAAGVLMYALGPRGASE
jgi:TrmH family RNA methyltransferase